MAQLQLPPLPFWIILLSFKKRPSNMLGYTFVHPIFRSVWTGQLSPNCHVGKQAGP